MKSSVCVVTTLAALLAGCATSPETLSCLQPNRRVAVEVAGSKVKPPPPPKPDAPAGKPTTENITLAAMAQGDSAWDYGSAVLKPSGRVELDGMVKSVQQGVGKDTRPTALGSVIIIGHTDRTEARSKPNLDEERAKVVRDYLVSKGFDAKVIFWEGRDAKDPVPVTKFCDS